MPLCGLADEREAYQDPNLSRSWENDEPVTADPTDTLQRVPLLRRKIKTSYGVREKKKSMAKRLSFCQILRKLRCHLNSNIFSITPQPEWSWDREHNDLAYKVDCASSWEERYGSVIGLLCSVGLMVAVGVFCVVVYSDFVNESEAFVEMTTTALTMPGQDDLPWLPVPPIASFIQDYSRKFRYDERYIRVEFIQNTISFSNSKPEFPRTRVVFPNRICWGFRLENNQPAPTICPDIWEESQADEQHSINAVDHVPHAQGDFADEHYHFFQVVWRRCSNNSDSGAKLVLNEDHSYYHTDEPCAPAADADSWLLDGAGGSVNLIMGNASTPNFSVENPETGDIQGDWQRHARFATGIRQSFDVFLSEISVTQRSKWGTDYLEEDRAYNKTYVHDMQIYLQNLDAQADGAIYCKFTVRCASQSFQMTRTPTKLSETFSKIGGFAKFLQVVLGAMAVWWTQRMFDRKTRDLYHMGKQSGHRIQFPQMTIDEHELDHALDEASVPKPVFDAFDDAFDDAKIDKSRYDKMSGGRGVEDQRLLEQGAWFQGDSPA